MRAVIGFGPGSVGAQLAELGRPRRVAQGEVLIEQGDEATAVYVVESGAFSVTVDSGAGPVGVGQVEAGDLIGELGPLANQRRSARVTAVADSVVREVGVDVFADFLETRGELAGVLASEAKRRVDVLRLVEITRTLFGDHSVELVEELVASVTWVDLRAGDELFAEGDEADSAFVVVCGRLSVCQQRDGQERVLRQMGRNEIVGELALVQREPRAATIRATRDTTLAEISAEHFERLLTRHPELALTVTRGIVERVVDRARPGKGPTRSVGVFSANRTTAREAIAGLQRTVEAFPDVVALTSERVDAALGIEGVAHARHTELDGHLLAEWLHEIDANHAAVVYFADEVSSEWNRSLAVATDCLLFVVPAEPTESERRALAEALDASRDSRAVRWLVVMNPAEAKRPVSSAALASLGPFDEVLHVRRGRQADLDRVLRLTLGRGVGLVLGGGGARGFAHIGVLRALSELGVPVDSIGGASMGSIFAAGGALYEAPSDLAAVCEDSFTGVLDYTLPVVSLIKARRITTNLEAAFGDQRLEDLWLPAFCVATNLTTAESEVYRTGDIVNAVRASIAIPGVMPPVARGRDLLVDGGVLNNLPADVMRADPSIGTVIAVDVVPSVGPRARAEYGMHVSGWRALRSTLGRKRSPYPGLPSVLMRTMIAGSERRRSLNVSDGTIDLYLDVALRGVGLLDFEQMERVVERGYESARPQIEAWLATDGGFGSAIDHEAAH